MSTFAIVVLLLLVGALLWGIALYNGLITSRNGFRNAFAQIDVQLQRRFDLIPNLVEVTKGYLAHERQTLEAVMTARGAALGGLQRAKGQPGDPAAMAQLAESEGALEGAIGRLLAVAEGYPDLKASHNMLRLTEELSSTENRVAFARQAFNDAVLLYNNRRETFPANLIATLFAFAGAALLQTPTERERAIQAPEVKF